MVIIIVSSRSSGLFWLKTAILISFGALFIARLAESLFLPKLAPSMHRMKARYRFLSELSDWDPGKDFETDRAPKRAWKSNRFNSPDFARSGLSFVTPDREKCYPEKSQTSDGDKSVSPSYRNCWPSRGLVALLQDRKSNSDLDSHILMKTFSPRSYLASLGASFNRAVNQIYLYGKGSHRIRKQVGAIY